MRCTVVVVESERACRDASQRNQTKQVDAWSFVQSRAPQAAPANSMKPQSLKALIRKGVPAEYRATVWFWVSGGLAKKTAAPENYYTRLAASSSNLSDDALLAIEQDVRTVFSSFRQHHLFNKSKGVETLSRVLMAICQHLPESGHFKGLHHIAALLLVVFGLSREEDVFFTLAALLEDRLYSYCNGKVLLTSRRQLQHSTTLINVQIWFATSAFSDPVLSLHPQASYGAKVEQLVLEKLVQKKLPRLSAHLAKLHVDLSTFTLPWLTSLFTSVLPPETLVRVWDCIFYEGSKVVIRTGLALLKVRHACMTPPA